MSAEVKSPGIIEVLRTKKNNEYIDSDWSHTGYIKQLDSNSTVSGKLEKSTGNISKAGRLKLTKFGFSNNINDNARIDGILIDFWAYIRNAEEKTTKLPLIGSTTAGLENISSDVKTNGSNLSATKSKRSLGGANYKWDATNLTPQRIKSDNFGCRLNFASNTSKTNEGRIYVDYARITVYYTNPSYNISVSSSANEVLKNGTVDITFILKEPNKINQGYAVPVQLTIPNGLEYQKIVTNNGSFDALNKKWNAKLGSNGEAKIVLRFKAIGSGSQKVIATEGYKNKSNSASVSIVTSQVSVSSNTPVIINLRQGQGLTYTLTAVATFNLTTSQQIAIPINAGVKVRTYSVSNGSSFDNKTGVFNAVFKNKKATLTLYLTATSPGTYSQNALINDSVVFSQDFIIEAEEYTKLHYISAILPESGRQYLEDGKIYTLACQCIVSETPEGLTSVYNGLKNNRIAVKQGIDEIIGSRCKELNIQEKIAVTFTYDESKPLEIKVYGQYLEMAFTNSFIVGGFELYDGANINEEYQNPIILFDNLESLIEDIDFTETTLPSNYTTARYAFKQFNFGGLEDNSKLIIRGISIVLDYSLEEKATLEAKIITKNNETNKKSIILDPEQSYGVIGSDTDKWGLATNDIDLNDFEVELRFANRSLLDINLAIKNIRLLLYPANDETNGAKGFTYNGQHSREYGIFLQDPNISEGAKTKFETLSLTGGSGEQTFNRTIEGKDLDFSFWIIADDIIEAQKLLTKINRWFSEKRDKTTIPGLSELIFDWDIERVYYVILSEEIEATTDVTTFKCKAKFRVPDGLPFNRELKTTGGLGTNEGSLEVKPTIYLYCTGGKAKIREITHFPMQEMEFTQEYAQGTEIIIDCYNRTIKTSNGEDISNDITLISDFFTLYSDYDFDSESENCIIEKLEYYEAG